MPIDAVKLVVTNLTPPTDNPLNQIRSLQRMSLWAVSLFSILSGKPFPPQRVLSYGDRFQMDGIDANAISTEMVGNEVLRNDGNEEAVEKSVGRNALTHKCTPSVSILISTQTPLPAWRPLVKSFGRDLNPVKKTLQNAGVNWVSDGSFHMSYFTTKSLMTQRVRGFYV